MDRRRIGVLAGVGALALSALVGVSPAHAAVGCYGSGCNGKDPQALGCYADAYTGSQVTTDDGRLLQLRYSPACGAAWGRLLQSYVGDYVAVTSSTGLSYSAYVSSSKTWTAMVDDHGSLTARAYHATQCCYKDSWTGWY
ncbi:DUF2690 domain-containing protein [Kitasatospora camelliae]|uniref:DUF2690 domain-containing protein n=1 Tax=Kitasatospora camelliae TaxID=3156397 RepID=A0AAU8K6E0_9ACTN